MRRAIAGLLAAGCLFMGAGCRTPDAARVRLLKAEIASLASAAKVAGPRSRVELARIESASQAAQGRVDEVAR